MTWRSYGENLEEKLTKLHDRIHKGNYRARPARRTYIPKADGTQRPLAVLCLEDKVVQQAVAAVLEAIYEEDFIGFSANWRLSRSSPSSQHLAAVQIGDKCDCAGAERGTGWHVGGRLSRDGLPRLFGLILGTSTWS